MQCPDHQTLNAFVLGETSSQAAEIATHVDTCSSCMDLVCGVVDQILKFPDPGAPTAGERAALDDEEIEDRWQDFIQRHGGKLGIRCTQTTEPIMSCPSNETLTQFVLGNPDNLAEIEAHVNGCAACTRFLDGVYEDADDAWREYLEAEARRGTDTEEEPEPEHQC